MKFLKTLKIEYWLLGFGVLAFVVGALIYPLRTYLDSVDGVFMESFSAFSHTLFFVLAWGFPYRSVGSIVFGGVLITAIVTWFEYLQDGEYLEIFANYLPDMIYNYAFNGMFDFQDVVAGYLGSALAVLLGILVAMKRNRV